MMFPLLLLLVQEPRRAFSVEELAAASPFSGVAVVERVGVRSDPTTGAVYTDATSPSGCRASWSLRDSYRLTPFRFSRTGK